MADNKLAPPPRNALARRSDPLQTLLRETEAAGPQYSELVGYLTARRMMPPVQRGGVFNPEATGEFQTGGSLPDTGQVSLRSAADPNTVVHELTHAAERQLHWQWSQLAGKNPSLLTPEQLRFKNAYENLIFKPGEQFGKTPKNAHRETAVKIAPRWAEENKDYRSNSSELSAFGMGGTVSPNLPRAPLHIDPTYATEFSILLDLARRAQPVIPGR